MPESWKITVAGMTGGAAALNGTWRLRYTGGCLWSTHPAGETNTVPGWDIDHPTSGVLRLFGSYVPPGDFHTAYYSSIPSASFVCMGPNTFTLVSNFNCPGAPGSITMTSYP